MSPDQVHYGQAGEVYAARQKTFVSVERAQSTWRCEFYATYKLPHRIGKLQAFVDTFVHKFNHHRSHDALGGQTPAEYLQTLGQGDPPPSHMC
jgi:putative transposase